MSYQNQDLRSLSGMAGNSMGGMGAGNGMGGMGGMGDMGLQQVGGHGLGGGVSMAGSNTGESGLAAD